MATRFGSPRGSAATTRVLIVDDHTVMRQGMVTLLASERGIEVVGDVGNGREAILAADATRPDVVLWIS